MLVLCAVNNRRGKGGDSSRDCGEWTALPRAAADAPAGSGGQKGGAAGPSAAALTLEALSGPEAPCHLQRPPGLDVRPQDAGQSLSCPVTVTWSSMPSDGLGKVLPIWSTIPLLRGEPPAPSVGTSPRALFPRTCCGSQIETALGPAAGGGRWAGRRAVPEPSAAAPPPGRASAAQPGDAAEARRIPAGQRCPPQRRGPGRRLRRLPAPRHRPRPPEAFPGVAAPGLPPRCALSLQPGFSDAPSRVAGPRVRPAPQTSAWRGTCPPPPICTWRSRSTSRPTRTSWRGTKVRDPCDGLRGGAGPVGTVFPFPNQSYPRVGTSKQQPEPALGTVRCSG